MFQSKKITIYEKNQLLKYSLKEADFLQRNDLPIEYFTGHVEFKNFDLEVNNSVLIPRVETEELVDLLIDFAQSKKAISYLEVGTGSGAISLSFLAFLLKQKELEINNFIVTDLSTAALQVAQVNFAKYFSEEQLKQVNFLPSDLLDNSNLKGSSFNLIVANLPYIPSREIENLDNSVKNYEPLLALDGGKTGFELINKLLEQIIEGHFLEAGGRVFLEVYENHDLQFISQNFPDLLKYFSIQEVKDQFARQRFLILQKI